MSDATLPVVDAESQPASRLTRWRGLRLSTGARCASPVALFMALGFLAPLITVIGFAFATPRTFAVFKSFTLQNFAEIFDPADTVWMSFAWSLALAFATVVVLLVICYPIAYGLVRVFGRWSALISIAFVFPLFISENVRLYGWTLFFINHGVLDGLLQEIGLSAPDVLFSPAITLFGMVYTYLSFMLFPMTLGLSMVPGDLIEAARDFGASRLMIWREIELPLAMPGILIGALLTFVLAAGAVAEAKILGGQSVIMISHDIEIAFTYSQNWPRGSALAVLLMIVIAGLSMTLMARLDLDRILGRR
ncbi:ABC transporter permease [Jiella sp. MQZ9-1]|uniref:ABC transporter permease n=1 Tax=Jiella flava TaxID=2816857 RepID=A0A939JWR0_9HYPH|nr:ABC transporter permease [Jiella flava]MBO0662571.1 ABC transporter permease [Jiella flava]MCD2472942.1 ABC transporter permease [Jiella flava]